MNGRERFLAALGCEELDRPPVWIMRQAGRYLPEYRALKEKYDFVTMVKTPELATEVSMQPLRRFALDAAIVFSDILVVNEAMGQPYAFRDGGGIQMKYAVDSPAAIDALDGEGAVDRLSYVGDALRLLAGELNGEKALLGFAAAPWTLAAYAVEGQSSEGFPALLHLFREDRSSFDKLLSKIADVTIEYLRMQAAAGADAVQLFDSWASLVGPGEYEEASLRWIRRIIDGVKDRLPVILYAKGANDRLDQLAASGASALSLDWTVDLPEAKERLSQNLCLQGNLDPTLLETDPEQVRAATLDLLHGMKGNRGHVLNLGHGIRPMAKVENVAALVDTVVGFGA
jgi:uroporphyrinogen decarboxylase